LADNNNNAPPPSHLPNQSREAKIGSGFSVTKLIMQAAQPNFRQEVDFVNIRVRKFIGVPWFRARIVLMAPHLPQIVPFFINSYLPSIQNSYANFLMGYIHNNTTTILPFSIL
jgi:hypothetical protein